MPLLHANVRRATMAPLDPATGARPWAVRRVRPLAGGLALGVLLGVLLGPAACTNGLLQPLRDARHHPEDFGLWQDEVTFATAGGARLRGWFIATPGRARATVVFFQDARGNMSRNLPAAIWLVRAGFNLFIFDYRGFGASPGTADMGHAVQDGAAALEAVRGIKAVQRDALLVYGQGIGGALAIGALRAAGTAGVRLLIVEDGFASFRETARLKLAAHPLTWAFQYPVAWLFFSDQHSPVTTLRGLDAPPLLVVHGEANAEVSLEAGRELAQIYPNADKAFWSVPAGQHLETFKWSGPWRRKLLAHIAAHLPPDPAPNTQDAPRYDRWRE